MKLVTFNIRCDFEQDGKNNFCCRRDMILEKLRQEKPDIICFQEVLPHVAAWLKENLESYYIVGCGRDEKLEDEQTAIAFLKQKFQMISMHTFWLSETPQVPASRYVNQSICPRTCTEVLLQDLNSKKLWRILNTHLDHEGSGARVLGMQQILHYIESQTFFAEAAVILAGDFNALPEDPEILLFRKSENWVDLTQGMEGTFHEYGTLKEPEKIDYIVAQPNIVCQDRGLWKDCREGVFLSDHYPVFVEITTK